MTLFELVKSDVSGLALHGLMHRIPDSTVMAVHIHGTGGDFYSNPFIVPLCEVYKSRGISYLTANYPGFGESAASERFDMFGPALERWIEEIRWDGNIILQGHSLGALKALSYLSTNQALCRRITGVVLLSPFDVVAFYCGGDEAKATEVRHRIRKLIDDEGSQQKVPAEIFNLWPITLGTMAELIIGGGAADQFPSRKGNVGEQLRWLSKPTFLALGSDDFAAFPNVENVVQQIKSEPPLELHLIHKAQHNFAGGVDELAGAVSSWLDKTFSRG